MKLTGWIPMVLALAFVACGPAKNDSSAKGTNAPVGENPLDAPADYLGAMSKAKKSAVRTVDIVSVRQAVQMFQVSEGRYPGTLQELVTEGYLPRLPDLPAGMRYTYDVRSGQVEAVAQ